MPVVLACWEESRMLSLGVVQKHESTTGVPGAHLQAAAPLAPGSHLRHMHRFQASGPISSSWGRRVVAEASGADMPSHEETCTSTMEEGNSCRPATCPGLLPLPRRGE